MAPGGDVRQRQLQGTPAGNLGEAIGNLLNQILQLVADLLNGLTAGLDTTDNDNGDDGDDGDDGDGDNGNSTRRVLVARTLQAGDVLATLGGTGVLSLLQNVPDTLTSAVSGVVGGNLLPLGVLSTVTDVLGGAGLDLLSTDLGDVKSRLDGVLPQLGGDGDGETEGDGRRHLRGSL